MSSLTNPTTDNNDSSSSTRHLGTDNQEPTVPTIEDGQEAQGQPASTNEQQEPSLSPSPSIITSNSSKLDLIEQLSSHNSEAEEEDDNDTEDQLVILFDEHTTITSQQEEEDKATDKNTATDNNALQLLTASDEEEQLNSLTEDEEDGDEVRLSLDKLPVELLLHIFDFIGARELQENVKLTCKRFNWILLNELSWKIRYERFWLVNDGSRFPPIQQQQQQLAAQVVDGPLKDLSSDKSQFPWSVACIEREEQLKYWTNEDLTCVELSDNIACVDTVRLIKNGTYLATGSRDRTMNVYNLRGIAIFDDNEINTLPTLSINKENAHLGWIWCLTEVGDKLICSGSWDNTIKLWDLEAGLQIVTEFKTAAPVLCCHSSTTTSSNLLIAGTFSRLISIYDLRTNQSVISYKGHRRSVLKVVGRKNGASADSGGEDFNEVISCGDDGRICLYDIRAKKGRNLIQLPANNYASCLSMQSKLSPISHFGYAGDKQGNLYLLDLERFRIVKHYKSMHTRPIQGITHSLGSIKTCSSDSTLNIYEPSTELQLINTKRFNYIGEGGPGNPVEITDLDCYGKFTVIGASDGIVRLFQ